jgi:ATP-dependent helicase/nuclease subunit A
MSERIIPDVVRQRQVAASDPATSAWVTANAGSGKTYVLTRRVIRLLMDGNDPAKILCLTFTKAAAAHMANEVFETLGHWATLSNDDLDRQIQAIEGRKPDARRRARARRLFAEALETPGGLKVQTIHAFCTGLLHQFPVEAGVPVSFDVLEERTEAELFENLRIAVMLEAAQKPDTPLGRAAARAMVAAADVTFAEVVREALGERDAYDEWLARTGSLEAASAELSLQLGIEPEDTPERIAEEVCNGAFVPMAEWPAIAATFQTGLKSDQKHGERLMTAASLTSSARCAVYEAIFFTGKNEPRERVCTTGFARKNPDLADRLLKEQERLGHLRERRRAVVARDRSIALATVTLEIADRYRREKERRGLLDYDDLIDKTLAVFDRVPSSWILYKLDLGIDQVLVDEAQDTSPKQWKVIENLVSEFTAGEGARNAKRRTVFAVGDEKQSIYSFQGAEPQKFAEMQAHFESAHRASKKRFETVPLQHSFRSAPAILEAVDQVFGRPEAFEGLSADNVATVHQPIRNDTSGHVEIWDILKPDEKAEQKGWDRPFDDSSEISPQIRLARKIAAIVKGWIQRGERTEKGPITPGDVLILVRARGPIFEGIIRALKDAQVEVAGADRLVLTEHIAIMDLLSLGEALLLPDNDLALAEVLKSPLFGLSEEELFDLAWQRTGTLHSALRKRAEADLTYAAALQRLDSLRDAARLDTPFAFYARLLGPLGGRKQMLARLGYEAADALDEFLALALDYERQQAPSLQGFISWLRAGEVEVKRDMDIVRDEVRVMTVHGAKGLEAPVVILADTTGIPAGPRDPRLLHLGAHNAAADAQGPIVWAGRKDTDPPIIAQARASAKRAAEDENRRLLYVGMTRAADRLIVCGARGVKEKPIGCWYDLVHHALAPSAEETTDEEGHTVWVWRRGSVQDEAGAPDKAGIASEAEDDPAWLRGHLPPLPAALAAISPSRALHSEARRGRKRLQDGHDGLDARARGTLVHRLLQSLPGLELHRREEAARRFCLRSGLDEAKTKAMLAEIVGILDHAAFAPLFAPGSRAEVSIVGQVTRADGAIVPVTGQVDRLVVSDGDVLIADFKTDRDPPRDVADTPAHYTTQLALYRAVIRRLYPRHQVRAALVWTKEARLVEIPGDMLDLALGSVVRDAA